MSAPGESRGRYRGRSDSRGSGGASPRSNLAWAPRRFLHGIRDVEGVGKTDRSVGVRMSGYPHNKVAETSPESASEQDGTTRKGTRPAADAGPPPDLHAEEPAPASRRSPTKPERRRRVSTSCGRSVSRAGSSNFQQGSSRDLPPGFGNRQRHALFATVRRMRFMGSPEGASREPRFFALTPNRTTHDRVRPPPYLGVYGTSPSRRRAPRLTASAFADNRSPPFPE